MKKVLIIFYLLLFMAIQFGCANDSSLKPDAVGNPPVITEFIKAADISFLPEMEARGTILYNNGKAEDMITTLKNAGCNAIRIRLWKDPSNGHSGFAEVKALASRVKLAGMKVWLTVHYSDTWADPGQQTTPAEWKNLSFGDLKVAVEQYTSTIMTEINPDIIQIGNETNGGFLWPQGSLYNISNVPNGVALMKAASTIIRAKSPNAKIMLHYGGISISGTRSFFNQVKEVDFDYIGLSYYPYLSGKDMIEVKTTIDGLGKTYNKAVIIAEAAYPFILDDNDLTHNVVGLDSQLIPGFPATPEGQKKFVLAIKALVKSSVYGQGFAYWGGEWIAFKGPEATDGSSYENQAFYDFKNNALPVLEAFKD